jgi:osmotically-inducible protein OsmY
MTRRALGFIAGLGFGAGLMYLLGTEIARRRRALAADETKHLANVTDDMIVDRVKSRMGHHTDHAHSIEVIVRKGRVTLFGAIPDSEIVPLLEAVAKVHGVASIENHLHARDDDRSKIKHENEEASLLCTVH